MALTPPMVPTTGKMVSILKTIKWKLVSVFTVKKVYIVKTQPINVIVERLLDQLYKEIEKTFNRNG